MYNVILFTDITVALNSPISIGAFKIAHVLRKKGYSCLVVNHFSHFTLEEFDRLIDHAVGDETFLVGFSTTFLQDNTLFLQGTEIEDAVFSKIKLKNNNIKFVVGGTQATPNYKRKNIDYVCLGYSEGSIINLAEHLTKNTTLRNATKNIWRTIVIDDKFSKEYDFQNEDMVWLPEDVVNHRVLPFEVARGCIFSCKFCSYPLTGKQQLDFVKIEDNMRKELTDNYEKYGITHYFLIDATFNDHIQKLEMMLRVVKGLHFQPIFWGYHRLDLICTRPETLKMLHEIGVRSMFFGIESLNPNTAKSIGKGYSIDKQIAMTKLIKETYPDITLHGSFIVGLPGESEDSVNATAQKLVDKHFPLDSWYFQPLRLFKTWYGDYSSDIAKKYVEYGYTDEGQLEDYRIIWKNDYFNFAKAKQFAEEVNARTSHLQYLEGRPAMGFFDIQYNDYEFADMIKMPKLSIDYNAIKNTNHPNFINQYKEKLFELIDAHLKGSGSESDYLRQEPPTPAVLQRS